MLSRRFLDFSVGEGAFVTGLSQISSFFSLFFYPHLKASYSLYHPPMYTVENFLIYRVTNSQLWTDTQMD